MTLRGLLPGFALVTGCAILLARQDVHAGTDAVFITSPTRDDTTATGHEAVPYDSEYAAAARLMGAGGNTPEADARPGEYYFLLGAHAFQKKDYVHAIQMYEVAASWAFKPAEYNLAVMYSRGQGIPADLPRGMAWMALAAERSEKRYVDAREAVYAEMTPEQFDQANAIWRELKKTYGDEVALRRAKARWAEVRANMTGSRVGSVGHLDVGIPSEGSGDPSGPKLTGAMAKKAASLGVANVRSTATSSAEAAGGQAVDGSTAYRQLRESDNPYDPKFQAKSIGTATVGPLTPVKAGAPSDATTDPPDATKQDQ